MNGRTRSFYYPSIPVHSLKNIIIHLKITRLKIYYLHSRQNNLFFNSVSCQVLMDVLVPSTMQDVPEG